MSNKELDKRKKATKKYRTKGISVICRWKHAGLIINDYNIIYNRWKNSIKCELCSLSYTAKNKKCMDHCHKTGKFRSICCQKCNLNMLDKKIQSNNTSGYKNIYYNNQKKKWVYEKIYYDIRITKFFNSLKYALCFKFIYLLKISAGLIKKN